jgi:hypothetical protein
MAAETQIYVVYNVFAEENRAVFSTREAAAAFIKTLPEYGPDGERGCQIDVFVLDAEAARRLPASS